MCLKSVTEELTDGFYRTNIYFGYGNNKSAIIIVAPKTAEKINREKLKGFVLDLIHS